MNENDMNLIKSFGIELDSEEMGSRRHRRNDSSTTMDEACFMFFPGSKQDEHVVIFQYNDWRSVESRFEVNFIRHYAPGQLGKAISSLIEEIRQFPVESVRTMLLQSYETTHGPLDLGVDF